MEKADLPLYRFWPLFGTVGTILASGCSDGISGSRSVKTYKHIFISNTTHNGNFGASAAAAKTAADNFCTLDAGNTNGGTYKALLGSSVRNTSTDWVLEASSQYLRLSDDAIIGTTNASSTFDFPLTHSFDAGTTGLYTWSGMDQSWGVFTDTCNGWTDGTTSFDSNYSYGNHTDVTAIDTTYTQHCNSPAKIICVEQ